MTAVVLLVVTITKFTHGAWLVFVLMPVLFLLMLGVNRYYRDVEKEIEVDPTTTFGSARRPRDRARRHACRSPPEGARLRDRRPPRHRSRPCTSRSTKTQTKRLKKDWVKQNIHVPLRILDLAVPRPQLPAHQVHQVASRGARLRGRHGLHAAVHRRPLVGEPAAQPQGAAHPAEAPARARRHRRARALAARLVRPALRAPLAARCPGQDRRGEPVRPVARRPLEGAAKKRVGGGR